MTTTPVPTILKYIHLNNNNYGVDQNIDMHQKPKKRRLDHLTWEEKLQRKKLKNRVAAQTSRDRKKAKMEEMESALQELFVKNEAVMAECKKLREANERLQAENASLLQRLAPPETPPIDQSRPVEPATADGLAASALQPRGAAAGSAATLEDGRRLRGALLALAGACLLYRTCSTSSTGKWTSSRSNNLPICSSKTSLETLKELLKRQLIRSIERLSVIIYNLRFRNQTMVQTLESWWGRHQKSWNPIGVTN